MYFIKLQYCKHIADCQRHLSRRSKCHWDEAQTISGRNILLSNHHFFFQTSQNAYVFRKCLYLGERYKSASDLSLIGEVSKCHRDGAIPSINARRVSIVWSSSTKDCVPSTVYRSPENTGNNARPSVIPQQTFSWRLINYSGKFRPVSIKQLKPLLGFVCGNFNWLAAWKLSSSLSISRSLACRDVPINGRLNNIYGSLLDNPSFFLQWYLSIKLYLILQYNL